MEAANLLEHEKVQVVALESGARLETYIIKGTRGSGTICMNGPAARHIQVGDTVIIMAFATMPFEEAKTFKPAVIFPKEDNTL
jgi:aspartate 1-decarboxylase